MKKFAAGVLAIATLAVGILAVRQWQSLNQERESGMQLRERVSALEAAQAVAATSPPPSPAILPTGVPAQSQAVATPPATAGAAQTAGAPTAAKPTGTPALGLASPQNMEMVRSMMRMLLPQQYPDIATDLNLSAAEVEKLFDTLARQQMDLGMGSMDVFSGGKLDPAVMQDMQRKMQQQMKANDAELAAMLGSKYPQWQDYQGTVAARRQVEQLQAALEADNRLSEAGRKTVTAALAVEEGRIAREEKDTAQPAGTTTQEVLENQLKHTTEMNQRRIAAASAHLTVAQRDTYRRLLEQQTSMAATMLRSMSAPTGDRP
jgi:hypothetical protein